MIYLNDNFKSGTTNFLKSKTGPRIDETIKEELKRGYSLEYSFKPKTGTALLFDHTLLHEGGPVLEGKKYLLRTDVVFKRKESFAKNERPWLKDPYYKKMIQYYQDAAERETEGDVLKSSELYERALSIRQFQPRK